MLKNFKTILRTVLLVLVGLILGVNVYLWNARNLMGNSLPMPFGYGAAVVLTGSMEPTIMADDLIFVAERESYEIDDIVVYQSGSILVVHRIVDMDELTVTTQGDANNTPDAPVRREMIKGEVVGTLPGAGGLVRLLKTPWVILTLIGGAVALSEMSIRSQKKKDLDELEQIKDEIRRLKDDIQ